MVVHERFDVCAEEVVVEIEPVGEVLVGSVPLSASDVVSQGDEGLNVRMCTPTIASWV